jgi:putative membrane protein
MDMMFDPFGFGLFAVISFVVSLVVAILFIVLIVLGIRWLLRQERVTGPAPGPPEDAALAILRERFARGEIDAKEYEERRRALGG